MTRPRLDHRLAPQQTLNRLDDLLQFDWAVATQVDDLNTQGLQPQERPPCNIIRIGKVALLRAVAVEDQRFPLGDPLDEPKDTHVRPTRGAVDGEIPEDRHVKPVEMVIRVTESLRRLLGRGIGGERSITGSILTKRPLALAIDARCGGQNKLPNAGVPAALQQIEGADDVRLEIGPGVLDTRPHPGTGRQVYNGSDW